MLIFFIAYVTHLIGACKVVLEGGGVIAVAQVCLPVRIIAFQIRIITGSCFLFAIAAPKLIRTSPREQNNYRNPRDANNESLYGEWREM